MTAPDTLPQSWRQRLATAIKQRLCSHTFAIEDLELVDENSIDARVCWPCAKCGRVFRAGGGFEILAHSREPAFRRTPR